MTAKYRIKQRPFEGIRDRKFWGRISAYGQWRRVAKATFDSLEAAIGVAEGISHIGLQETAVFYRGKKVWSHQ